MKPNIIDAIKSLDKDAEVAVGGFGTDDITWMKGTTVIPKEAIDTELARLQAEYDAQEYARKREAEYPSIQECVHAILDDDLTALQKKRKAVKTKYHKS